MIFLFSHPSCLVTSIFDFWVFGTSAVHGKILKTASCQTEESTIMPAHRFNCGIRRTPMMYRESLTEEKTRKNKSFCAFMRTDCAITVHYWLMTIPDYLKATVCQLNFCASII